MTTNTDATWQPTRYSLIGASGYHEMAVYRVGDHWQAHRMDADGGAPISAPDGTREFPTAELAMQAAEVNS